MKTASIIIQCVDGTLKVSYSSPNENKQFSRLLGAVKAWSSAKFHNSDGKKYWSVDVSMFDMKDRFCVGHFRPNDLEWERVDDNND